MGPRRQPAAKRPAHRARAGRRVAPSLQPRGSRLSRARAARGEVLAGGEAHRCRLRRPQPGVYLSTGRGVRLIRLALHDVHAEHGARFSPFAGFEMPLQYSEGLRAEHLHTRAAAGLFDVSHMGQLRVRGPELHRALERALPLDFDGWPEGEQRYSLLLNEHGGIVDDVMVTRLAGEVRIVVNASGRQKDLERLRALCPALTFELLDEGLLALQGPSAEKALQNLEGAVTGLAFMQARAFALGL